MEASQQTPAPPARRPNGLRRARIIVSALEDGANRQARASIWALIFAWTGLPVMLWLAGLGLVAGLIAGIFGSQQPDFVSFLHVNEGAGVVGAVAGGFVGALGGFLLIVVGYISNPAAFLGAFISGMFIAALVLYGLFAAEPKTLAWRGYRKPSRREKELLDPLVAETCERMGMRFHLHPWIADLDKPAAWSHMRAIVITTALLGDYDESERQPKGDFDRMALSAILAHETHHWQIRDPIGLSWVWSCFWPVVLLFNAGTWLREKSGFLGTLGWILFWPAWITTKLIVVPIMTRTCQEQEYEADARVASLGDDYRLGLRRALTELRAWESPRSGWEEALAQTHPPIELRLERLEAPQAPVPETMPVPVPAEPRPAPRPPRPTVINPEPPQPPEPEADPPEAEEPLVLDPEETAPEPEEPPAPKKPRAPAKPRPKKPPPDEPSDAAAQWGIEPGNPE